MMLISTFAGSAVSASFVHFPNILLSSLRQLASNDRLVHLAEAKSSKSYECQRSSLHKELVNFLCSIKVPKALPCASPSDIEKFLVWKDILRESRCSPFGLSRPGPMPARLLFMSNQVGCRNCGQPN